MSWVGTVALLRFVRQPQWPPACLSVIACMCTWGAYPPPYHIVSQQSSTSLCEGACGVSCPRPCCAGWTPAPRPAAPVCYGCILFVQLHVRRLSACNPHRRPAPIGYHQRTLRGLAQGGALCWRLDHRSLQQRNAMHEALRCLVSLSGNGLGCAALVGRQSNPSPLTFAVCACSSATQWRGPCESDSAPDGGWRLRWCSLAVRRRRLLCLTSRDGLGWRT